MSPLPVPLARSTPVPIPSRSTTPIPFEISHQPYTITIRILGNFTNLFSPTSCLRLRLSPLDGSLETNSSPGRGLVLSLGVRIPNVIQKKASMPVIDCARLGARHPRITRAFNADGTGGFVTSSWTSTRTKP